MKRVLALIFILGIALFLTSCTQTKTSDDQNIVAENTGSQESPPDLITGDISSDLSNQDIEDLNVNLDPESIG